MSPRRHDRKADLVRGITQGKLAFLALKQLGEWELLPESTRYDLGLVDRPNYAYGLLTATREAKKLGHSQITAIEFGVGAGNGLLAMEECAAFASRKTGVEVQVVGFDSGEGLPAPVDFRDVPYVWDQGFYEMDADLLKSRIQRAELVLGDVRNTLGNFLAERSHQLLARPIGFVSFDLDYWSSTMAAFDIFRSEVAVCLPHVWCYFDDIPWTIEDIGELRAIRDFNEESERRKIRHQSTLRLRLPFHPVWAEQIYQAHLFDHPDYNRLLAAREAGLKTLND